MQLHALSAFDCVLTDPDSSVFMIASSSERFFEAPDIEVPPVRWTFVAAFLSGEPERVLGALCGFGFGSEIKRPAAEGGSLFAGGVCVLLTGSRRARICEVCWVCVCRRPACGPRDEGPALLLSPFRYAVPCPSNVFVTCRGAGVCKFAFFFPPLPPLALLAGTSLCAPCPPPDADEYDCPLLPPFCADCVCVGTDPRLRRCALKLDMNSKLAADSPRKFLKRSAAPSGDMVEAFWRSCLRSSSGR